MQQRTADLGGKPVLDASFTGSRQLSCKLINEAMAAPGSGSVLVSIGTSTGTGLGQTWTDTDLPWPGLVLGLGGLGLGLVELWAWVLAAEARVECFEKFDAAPEPKPCVDWKGRR